MGVDGFDSEETLERELPSQLAILVLRCGVLDIKQFIPSAKSSVSFFLNEIKEVRKATEEKGDTRSEAEEEEAELREDVSNIQGYDFVVSMTKTTSTESEAESVHGKKKKNKNSISHKLLKVPLSFRPTG